MVDNEKEALALENNLIKQKKPRYNILLRDDKTYPYIKLTIGERYPRVYRRRAACGATERSTSGRTFPANLAYRIVDLIHRHFLIPSCKLDLKRYHPRPCLQYYIGRCLGPCVEGLTTPERYAEAVHDVRMFLEGRRADLSRSLQRAHGRRRRARAVRTGGQVSRPDLDRRAAGQEAAHGRRRGRRRRRLRLPLRKPDAGREPLPHARRQDRGQARVLLGRPRRAWSATAGFEPGEFFSALLKQVYLDQQYVPHTIYVPVDFEDRVTLEEVLSEGQKRRVQIHVPQRGEKRSLIDLVGHNAKQSYDQRFRVMKPAAKAIQEALQDALMLPELPKRIECFDISHIQGAETVASMVVWEDGKMKKSDYRKFIIKGVEGVDDFASMREVVTRRYKRVQEEKQTMPSLVLIDGGIGQLHAAAEALEALGIINQPLASIAKREEIIYVQGQEDEPVVLDRHSPVLHLVQLVRDEAHRFAVTFHRKRRQMRDRKTELLEIPGVGERTTSRLLQHFGSLQAVKEADAAALASVVSRPQADAILRYFGKSQTVSI